MTKDKKELAAIAAVIDIITGEETATFIQRVPGEQPSPWQAWGRGQTMQYRDITQRRIIKRVR